MGVYVEMIIKGVLFDVVIYIDLINGYFKKGDIKVVFQIYKEMQEVGMISNVFIISCLIDGLCKDGYVNDVFKCFLEYISCVYISLVNYVVYIVFV